MSIVKALFTSLFPSKTPPAPPPAATPNLLAIEGQYIDLNQLSAAQLAALEAQLIARRQQRETELATYLHALAAERHRLQATTSPEDWLLTLKLLFGEVLGRRVAARDIGPGMQLQHLVLGLGQPDELETSAEGVTLRYGDPLTGSYYHLEGDVITKATVLTPPTSPLALPAG